MLDEVQKKFKTAYKHFYNSNRSHCYIQLALVQDEMCDIRDKKLNEITRHTLQGQVDEILKIKEPLKTLEDIFHYNNLPCPRLLLIIGAPGKCYYLYSHVYTTTVAIVTCNNTMPLILIVFCVQIKGYNRYNSSITTIMCQESM